MSESTRMLVNSYNLEFQHFKVFNFYSNDKNEDDLHQQYVFDL